MRTGLYITDTYTPPRSTVLTDGTPNGDPTNNHVDNLMWGNAAMNNRHPQRVAKLRRKKQKHRSGQ